MQRVPSRDAIDLLTSGRDCDTENTTKGDEDTKPDSLGPENLLGVFSVASEIGHVESECCFWSDGSGNTLKEDHSYRSAVFDVGCLREGWSKPLCCIYIRQEEGKRAVFDIPATRAQMKRVRPKIGITIVFAMKRNLNLETCSQRRGN